MQSHTHTNEEELEFYLSHPSTRSTFHFSNPPQPQRRQQVSPRPQSTSQQQMNPTLLSSRTKAKTTRPLPAERYNVDMDLYFSNKDLRDEIWRQMLAATAGEGPIRARL